MAATPHLWRCALPIPQAGEGTAVEVSIRRMRGTQADLLLFRTSRRKRLVDTELEQWFEREGLLRYAISGNEHGEIVETVCGPLIALGPGDDDFVTPPRPDQTGYACKALAEMTLDDFNGFIFHWLEHAAVAGDLRCAQCGRSIVPGDDLPDADTWDAIMIGKEIVAWMAVHFDCKKKIARKLKGLNPFELTPQAAPRYDLAAVVPAGVPAGADPQEEREDASEWG